MYGKEGKKQDYTPYSCLKIIMNHPPDQSSWHGCPFKHSGDVHLTNLLVSSLKIQSVSPEVKDIVQLAKSSNYQIACQRHFEVLHPGYLDMPDLKLADSVANHPNQWYLTSVNYHKLKNGKSAVSESNNNMNNNNNSSNSANAVVKEEVMETDMKQP